MQVTYRGFRIVVVTTPRRPAVGLVFDPMNKGKDPVEPVVAPTPEAAHDGARAAIDVLCAREAAEVLEAARAG